MLRNNNDIQQVIDIDVTQRTYMEDKSVCEV